ncbi:alpha-amylase [Coprinopsis sp. MPI-PUGE-AT-0042]|nr:alpha-amylase [Coprinopsis sp. MPI-PUGE-AT-0042]
MLSLPILYSLFASLTLSRAATADEWRGRSIYQVITDRFAHPTGSTPPECDTGSQTWCGGTWKGILDHLDYIQDAGFTAIWISPVNKNYEGPRTAYGDPYHGYWVTDVSQLNSKFGTSDDLHALVDGLHRRGMYIMVDVVVNHVMATSTTPDYSNYFFKDASFYHPYCPIDYSNATSTELCWMGDERVPLPDVDTSNPTVIERYGEWIQNFVKEYKIDGLRIDAAKHVQKSFWPDFCGKAGVFCMGEVFGGAEVDPVAEWQGPLDSVLNFPMYTALRDAYSLPGPANITGLISVFEESRKKFKDTTLLGNFLENHDVPRWHNLSVDPQSLYNAMAWNFLTEGIPIVYYGQEHGLSGAGDPHNREALWPTQYTNSTGYNFTTTLNQFRNFLVNSTDWLKQETQILTTSPQGVAFLKGNVVSILTNIGSPPQPQTHIAVKTPYSSATALTNILTCQQWVVGTQGAVEVQYSLGGVPVILMPSSLLDGSGMCGAELDKVTRAGGRAVPLNGSAISSSGLASSSLVALLLAALSALLL